MKDKPKPSTLQASGPLFVISMWRSGSSLPYALLNTHPQVSLMFEADLVLLRYSFLKLGRCQDWQARSQVWNVAHIRHGFTNRVDRPGAKNFHDALIAV